MASESAAIKNEEHRQILGVNFYIGDLRGALARMAKGGLLVVPAAPALKDLPANAAYREALLNADVVITDSAFMVMIWNFIQRDSIPRLSGLEYLVDLLRLPDVQAPGNTFWVMAGAASAGKNLDWLCGQGVVVPENCVYLAPMYGDHIHDPELLRRVSQLRPQHIVVTVGGGVQERLGLYLKRQLDYRPAIHCVGAAIAFLSGDQVQIPLWADRFYLGWLFRCISAPGRYIPRYWSARKLLPLMLRFRDRLPSSHPTRAEESGEAA
ncbi:MAG TPA: WecB/TagA/CpsF family glycosyltransferase [Acidobacteriaceae bacterium]|nr:WecB/TagA/CpsF family glycosyltransferase [Acidobacteriaceae bacterium]